MIKRIPVSRRRFLATAAASTLIVVTLLPIVLLYRLVRRYELSML